MNTAISSPRTCGRRTWTVRRKGPVANRRFGLPVLVLALAASCGPAGLGDLQDGTYAATYMTTDEQGWVPFMRLTVEGGSVRQVVFDSADPDGELKSADAETQNRMREAAGTTTAEAAAVLSERLISNQRLPVDSVSGATASSRWFNELAEGLVERARAGDTRVLLLPMSAAYTAEDEPDERGWVGTIRIAFEGRSMAEVRYDEVRRENGRVVASKREDEAYGAQWQAETGVSPAEVYSRLEAQLMAEGRPAGVDVISGATAASRRFRTLAREALARRVPVDHQRILDRG